MPLNSDPTAIAFCNQTLRPAMDQLAGAANLLQSLISQWNAKGLASVILATGDFIDDGSAPGGSSPQDGRTPITDVDVNTAIANCGTIAAALTANSNAILLNVLKIAVNP